MVSMLAYSNSNTELKEIEYQAGDIAAFFTDEKWDIVSFSSMNEVAAFFACNPLVHLTCYDITEEGSIKLLGRIRSGQEDMLLMLIADAKMSPMDYVRPDIMASSLIIRPFSEDLLRDKLRDLILKHIERMEKGKTDDFFVVETREGKTLISYRRIYYFEARDKRIYIRLRDKEYAFYDTIDELEQKLPNNFLRCHRSFMINRLYMEKINFSRNEICMAYDIKVPLSRSYKLRFRHF